MGGQDSEFLVIKHAIDFLAQWHQAAPQLKNGDIHLNHFPARMFGGFCTKRESGGSGDEKKIADELEVLKTRNMMLVGFRVFPVTK